MNFSGQPARPGHIIDHPGQPDRLQIRLLQSFYRNFSKTAIQWGELHVTYSHLHDRAGSIFLRLKEMGLENNRLIGICLENPIDRVAVMLGSLYARQGFLVMDPSCPGDYLETVLHQVDMEVIFLDETSEPRLLSFWQGNEKRKKIKRMVIPGLFFEPGLLDRGWEADREWEKGDRVCFYVPPGQGTRVKTVACTNESLVHAIDWEIETMGIHSAHWVGHLSQPDDEQYIKEILVPLGAGATLCIQAEKESLTRNERLAEWLDKHLVHLLHLERGDLKPLLFTGVTATSFPCLTHVVLPGENLLPGDVKKWFEVFGERIVLVNLYGFIETGWVNAFYLIEPDDSRRARIPVGKAIPPSRVDVLDEDLEECDDEWIGDIYICIPMSQAAHCQAGESREHGFINIPGQGNQEECWFCTGDKGKRLEDGNLEIISRGESRLKPAGTRVKPGESKKLEPGKSTFQAIEPAEKREYYPLSSAQKRLYVLQLMDRESMAYNMSFSFPLDGEPDREKLLETFKKLINRHENFRTAFLDVNGQTVQRIYDDVPFSLLYHDMANGRGGESGNFIRPFDLGEAPLMRAGLIAFPGQRYVCWADMHHIIADGTSLGILHKDFILLASGIQLPGLKLQYKDFSQWQLQLAASGALKQQEDYWLGIFADAPGLPRLNLPTDFPRPRVFSFTGGHYIFSLGGREASMFRQMGARNGATLYMNIMAVLNVLFYKYTGQNDIIIGSGIMGRRHADLQNIIGMFVNMLPVRCFPRPGLTYLAFLEEVVKTSIQVFENQDMQFEELVNQLELERDPSRNPLFDISMVVQNFQDRWQSLARDENEEEGIETPQDFHPTSKFDMTFFITEEGDAIDLIIEYYTGILKPATIERVAAHFQQVVRTVSNLPMVTLADIDIISEEEKHQLLYVFNDTVQNITGSEVLHRLVEEQVERFPHHVALVEERHHVTFKKLDFLANRLAGFLALGKNIQEGEPVGLLLSQPLLWAQGIMGILKAGGAYVPLDPGLPKERLRVMINDASLGIMISETKHLRVLNRLQWECPSFHTYICLDSANIGIEIEKDESRLMNIELWQHVAETAKDDITGGGWVSSFTGEPFSRQEMDEYSDNVYQKLKPLLRRDMRVLEIGCASGLTMYRIAPGVGHYTGTDLSEAIIKWNQERIKHEKTHNITLLSLAAHDVDQLEPGSFDLVIINSVVQCFPGHHYLRHVIGKCIALLGDKGYIFVGDVMDQDKKRTLEKDLLAYKQTLSGSQTRMVKTDLSAELFVSRDFWIDARVEIKTVQSVVISDKIYTLVNELTAYRYDVLLEIDKTGEQPARVSGSKQKYQEDSQALTPYQGCFLSKEVEPVSLAYIIYTSGTSGWPKGVQVEHRGVVNTLKARRAVYGLGPGDTALQLFSYAFDGFVTAFFTPLISGSRLVLLPREEMGDTAVIRRVIRENNIMHFICVPPLYGALLETLTAMDWKGVKIVTLAGDRLDLEMVKTTATRLGHLELVNEYGITEASVMSTIYRHQERDDMVKIGKPVWNTCIYILDERFHLQPIGIAGELFIGGYGVARGYLNNPGLTAGKFSSLGSDQGMAVNLQGLFPVSRSCTGESRLYRSGDLARWLKEGNLEYLGRLDFQVKIRGFRIETREIEARLLHYSGVKEALVTTGLGNGDKKKDLYAYIVAPGEIDVNDVKEYLGRHLPHYMIPAGVMKLDHFPIGRNGKIDRGALPVPGTSGETNYAAPRNGVEKALVKIWKKVLNLDDIPGFPGIDDNFFSLGGHSLKATILVSLIHKDLGVKISLTDVFKCQTIRALAGTIAGMEIDRRYSGIKPVEKREYYALSSAQKRLYFLQEMDGETTSYNMPLVVPLGEHRDFYRLEKALQALVARHESLRTSFIVVDDEVVQRVHEGIEIKIDRVNLDTGTGKEAEDFIRPFDLGKVPLIRAAVLEMANQPLILAVDMHHIISDGTSHTILVKDFTDLYNGNTPGPLLLHYKDFSGWQNSLKERGEIKGQEDYWLALYQDAREIPRLDLPVDYPRPGVFTFSGGNWGFFLDREAADALKRLGSTRGGTLYMCLLAVLNVLFYKYTGQEDIVIGCGIAGRQHADLQGIIGMFVNMLAMRNQPKGCQAFQDFLDQVIERSIDGFENQDVQFEELVDHLELERDASRNPLFDIAMVVQNFQDRTVGESQRRERITAQENLTGPGLTEIAGEKFKQTAKFDITFFVSENSEGVGVGMEYYTGIFSLITIQRMANHLKRVIDQVVKNPLMELRDIELVTGLEKKQLVEEWNDIKIGARVHDTIAQWFKKQVEETAGRVAIIEGDIHLSYNYLEWMGLRVAGYLKKKKNLQTGEPVGVWMSPISQRPVAVLGVLLAGGVWVPLDPQLPAERISFILKDANIRVVIGEKKVVRDLNRLQWECPGFDHFLCLDSNDIYKEEEQEINELMNRELWHHVGEAAEDDIAGGGWKSSYTGEPLSRAEMDEYGNNVLLKLQGLLQKDSRVLEIGSASGITMFNIAPRVGLYYGTDLSEVIIHKTRLKANTKGYNHIKLANLAAHEIDRLEEKDFNLVIINSVIQCFHGLNYLRRVIRLCIDRLGTQGVLFIGDVMDQAKKTALEKELVAFKYDQSNRDKKYTTKTSFSAELFINRDFWEDLAIELPGIQNVEISEKQGTIENELKRFRYDVLLHINKKANRSEHETKQIENVKRKFQDDCSALEEVNQLEAGNWLKNTYATDLAYIIYTSGTAGRPKGVAIENGSLVDLCQWHHDYYRIGCEDHATQYAGFGFDASVWEFFPYILKGGAVHLLADDIRLDVEALNRYFERHDITIAFLPTQLCEQFMTLENKSLRVLLTGGDKLRTFKRQRYALYNNYGPTENTVVTTAGLVQEQSDNIPIGQPTANSQVYILDKEYRCLQPVGVPGELCIGGNKLARGYLDNPELTHEKFAMVDMPGFNKQVYKSGDLARWLSNGIIEFLGRMDRQVKIRGFRIETGEIEARLMKHPLVQEAVVKLVETGNEKDACLCAYVVQREAFAGDELKSFLGLYLPVYMIPAYVQVMEKLPLTVTGKVDYRALPAPAWLTGESDILPGDEIENKLAMIWADILGLERARLGLNSHFFDIGGHSLKATVMVARVHKELNVKIPLAEVFKQPTLRGLAQYIRGAVQVRFTGIEPVEKKEYDELAPAQRRLFFIQQLDRQGVAYNMPQVIPLDETLDFETIARVFSTLIDRHESFRTSFIMMGSGPVQRIHETVMFKVERRDAIENELELSGFVKPFDLTQPPLLRATVVNIQGRAQWLFVDMHHIIGDGVSMDILQREVPALLKGKQLPRLKLQYRDYSGWLNRELAEKTAGEQEKYWMKCLSGDIPVLDLPLDFQRPFVQGAEGSRVAFFLGDTEKKGIMDLAKKAGATQFMVLLAIFQVLLSRLSGQDDIIVGTPVAGRRHVDLQDIIGMFVNTLPLRGHVPAHEPFAQFLENTKEMAMGAFENQEYPFEEMVERVKVKRDVSRNPLFDVMFTLRDENEAGDRDKGMAGSGEDARPWLDKVVHQQGFGISKFDMTLNVTGVLGGLRCEWEYSTRLFKPGTIERLVRYFRRMVKGVTALPGQEMSEIDMITDAEKEEIIQVFNNTGKIYRPGTRLNDWLDEQSSQSGDRVALADEGNAENREGCFYLTYGELKKQGEAVSKWLNHKGFGKNSLVALLVKRSITMVIGIWGILKAGGAYCPMDISLPVERIKYMLADSGAAMVLTTENLEFLPGDFKKTGELIEGKETLRLWVKENEAGTGDETGTGPLAYIIYTSGSTGRPKGVMVEHGSLLNAVHWQGDFYGISHRDHGTQYASIGFDAAVLEIFPYLMHGAAVYLVREDDRLDLERLNRFYERHDITIGFLPTPVCEQFMQLENKSLRVLYTGGDRLRVFTQRSYRLANNYGPTENTVATTAGWIDETSGLIDIGKPVYNNQVVILGPGTGNEQLQPVGVTGELCIGGASLARGYLNNPELTNEKFISTLKYGRLYKTGDLGRWRENGSIEFVGRKDTQVKIRGYRIELEEIEKHLLEYENIKSAAVKDWDPGTGEKFLCGYLTWKIIPDNNTKPAYDWYHEILDLKQYLEKHLPVYMIPSFFMIMETLPLSLTGKLDRHRLPRPQQQDLQTEESYSPPVSDLEKQITSIWQQVLGVEKVGVKDNFFDRGGTSLSIVKVQYSLKEKLGKDIPLVQMFRYPTVQRLAGFLNENEKEAAEMITDQEIDKRMETLEQTFQLLSGENDDDNYWE